MRERDHKQAGLSDVYDRLSRSVSESIIDYLEAPNGERTHDLRVAIRRFQTLTKQVPRSARGKALWRYRKRYAKFLSLTTEMRDLDIIRERLNQHPASNALPLLLNDLALKRRKLVKASVKMARKLRDSKAPKKAAGSTVGARPRIRKSLREYDNRIPRTLALVLRSERSVAALHRLKKEVRRYRYLLELIPQSLGVVRASDSLRQLQDKLGEIRDGDVLIDYLEVAGASPGIHELLDAERNFRHARYEDLVRVYPQGLGDSNQSVLAMAGLVGLRTPVAFAQTA